MLAFPHTHHHGTKQTESSGSVPSELPKAEVVAEQMEHRYRRGEFDVGGSGWFDRKAVYVSVYHAESEKERESDRVR